MVCDDVGGDDSECAASASVVEDVPSWRGLRFLAGDWGLGPVVCEESQSPTEKDVPDPTSQPVDASAPPDRGGSEGADVQEAVLGAAGPAGAL